MTGPALPLPHDRTADPRPGAVPRPDPAPGPHGAPDPSGGRRAPGASGEERPLGAALLATLGLLTAISPLAMDLYLPAFPRMVPALATTAAGVQLTLTAYLVGAGVGQVLFGALADRVGRRGPLVAGTAACVAAGVVTVVAPGAGVLVAARFVQGLCGAAGLVVGRAVVTDLARGRAAAAAFSLITIVSGVAPVVAPMLGSVLVGVAGWRGLLAVTAAVTLVALVAVVALVPESLTPRRRAQLRAARAAGAARPWHDRRFVGNTVAFGFAFAAMMGYVSASPFLFQQVMGLGPVAYAALFGLNAAALTVVGALSARAAAHVAPVRLLRSGTGAMAVAAVLFAVLTVLPLPAGLLEVPLFVCLGALGLVMGNATALALAPVRASAGQAAAVLGAFQFAVGAVATPLVGLAGEGTAVPLGLVLVVCTVVAWVACTFAARAEG